MPRKISVISRMERPSTSIAPILEKDEKGRKGNKVPTPVWPEWTDQDIATEKWDTGHRGRVDQKGKSPNASIHFFEEPEGRIELPTSLKDKVHSWRRPQDFVPDGKNPVVVEFESLKCKDVDLITSSESVADSELMRWIVSGVTALWKIQNPPEQETSQSFCLLKPKQSKEQRESKPEKGKKESEIFSDELSIWKPWYHIWPKDNNRFSAVPNYNSGGKYCLKIFWMGTWRKITVDDFMPFDEKGKILLPTTKRENELWPMLLSKALIKVASLDYAGGNSFSEMGDSNIIHLLTGWLPEPIPLKYGHSEKIWKLLLEILPNWKLPAPSASTSDGKLKLTDKDSKLSTDEEIKKEDSPRPEVKESKEGKESKGKKDEKEGKDGGGKEKNEKGKTDKQKDKNQDKADKEGKSKDKVTLASTTQARINTEPEFVVFASYSPPSTAPLRVSTLKEMADSSEKLRQFGLSHNHPHPVHLTTVRNCPLVAPPTPIPIPRWKLIRQKKKQQIVEPPIKKEAPKPPMFVELASPFINYCVSPIPVNRIPTPVKWKKFRPETPMDSVSEEDKNKEENEELKNQQESKDENDNITENTGEVLKSNEDQKTAMSKLAMNTEKEKPEGLSKNSSMKSSLTGRRERTNSDKSTLGEGGDMLERRPSRKVSMMSPKSEHGSAKNRKFSKMERLEMKVADKMEKETKESKELKTKSRETSKEHIEVPSAPEIEINKPEEEAEVENNEKEADKADEDAKEENKNEKKQELWMEYDDFCQCFSTLWIFHKSQTYSYYKGHAELKSAETKTDKNRKSVLNPNPSNVAPTPSGRYTAAGVSPSTYGSHQPLTDTSTPYMFVDSLSKIELLVSFASFSRWFEPLNQGFPPLKEKDKEGSDIDDKSAKDNQSSVPPSGTLIAEPYSWKSLVTGQPSLRIKTTGIKGAVLTLPPGRHVLRFMIQAPIGYHVDICSQTPFVFGDEDMVMQNLTKESLRYSQHATQTLQNFMDIINKFQDPVKPQKMLELGSENEPPETFARHFEALFQAMSQAFTEKKCGTFLAIEALKLDSSICLKKSLTSPSNNSTVPEISQATDDATSSAQEQSASYVKTENNDREKAANKIQALFRGHLARTLMKARQPGTSKNAEAVGELRKMIEVIEANTEQFALQVYRNMFRDYPDLFKLFPFYKDEWTRISYADYNGNYPEQPVNSWFIVFRETFYVEEPVLVVPKLYVNIPSCVLRVVDNDTGDELPRVFVRVAPRVLQKNKNGYTFVAEARSTSASVPAGKFRMRLIGASDPLPKPYKEGLMNTNFTTKEIRDYYIPNRNNLIFRYTVRVTNDHQVSIQLGTSKTDVYIKLDILDNEVVVASGEGKGHTVIPAFTFLRDHNDDDDEKTSHRSSRQGSGRSSVKGGRAKKDNNAKRAISPFEKTAKKITKGNQSANQSALFDTVEKITSQGKLKGAESTETLDQSTDETDQTQTHKYIIQATVLRDSWPLSRSQWDFVGILKNLEKTDGEAVETSTKTEKHSAGPKGKKGGKDSKDGRTSKPHQNTAGSRPGSQQFDNSKPNWVLRVVSDASSSDIEIKKDTERQDEIKAMKAAWEAAEPGRAAKAQQSRLKYLNENMVRVEKENKDPNQEDGEKTPKIDAIDSARESVQVSVSPGPSIDLESSELTLAPPVKEQETILKTLDITPFIRSTGKRILLDEAEEEKLQLKMEEKVRAYREFRERVLEDREEDRIARNIEKEKQLQEYEDMQAKLDESRQLIHAKREAYRQKFLEQPPPDNESDTSKKRKTPSPTRGRKSPRSKSPKNTGKSKSPPKGKKK